MATRYDLEIVRGSTYSVRIAAKDDDGFAIDLTNYTVGAHAKLNYSSPDILFNFNPVVVAGQEANGYIDINVSAAITATLPITQAVYDIEIYSADLDHGGVVAEKIMQGYIDISPEVTT